MWAGAAIFQWIVDVESLGPLGYLLFPNLEMTVALFVLMPLSVLLSIEARVLISSRVSDVRAAQQAAGVLGLAFVIIYVASHVTLGLDAEVPLCVSGLLAPLAVALYLLSVKTFRREEIVTRWKSPAGFARRARDPCDRGPLGRIPRLRRTRRRPAFPPPGGERTVSTPQSPALGLSGGPS